MDYHIPKTHCPNCHVMIDGAGDIFEKEQPRKPQPGDTTVCIQCGAVLRFGPSMELNAVTDYSGLPTELLEQIEIIKSAVRVINKKPFDN